MDEDGGLVGHLEVAAPEIVAFQGKMYLAALQPELDGIRVAELGWRQVEQSVRVRLPVESRRWSGLLPEPIQGKQLGRHLPRGGSVDESCSH